MALHDLLGDRQTDAGARVLAATVQALKDQEDALDVLRLDTDAVVPQPEKPIIPPALPPNIDEDRFIAAELDSVAEQILEELYQLRFIGLTVGKGSVMTPAPLSSMAARKFAHTVLSTAAQSVGAKSLAHLPTRE